MLEEVAPVIAAAASTTLEDDIVQEEVVQKPQISWKVDIGQKKGVLVA